MVRIATWNVNSLRVRLSHVLAWLATAQPDMLALQETKLTDESFPLQELADAGYQVIFSGQKTYNGVALLSRLPFGDIVRDVPGLADPQRRVLGATVVTSAGTADAQELRVLNLYIPNGQSVGSDKYQYKLDWLAKVADYIEQQLIRYPRLVVLGDFNIAPGDQDVHDPAVWEGQVMVSPGEREFLATLFRFGMCDTFRLFEQAAGIFSWWDYRAAGFRRNLGLRIDLIMASSRVRDHCVSCSVDQAPRKLDRPSDHAPVVANFNI